MSAPEQAKHYDPWQQQVIDATGGYHLVLAAPGCGKTEVLAERIRRAAERGIAFDDMLCLTFTNRAARSMADRVRSMSQGVEGLYVGNIHRYCSKLLFEQGIMPVESSVIDEEDSISILADIMNGDELKMLADTRQRHRCSQAVNLSHFMHQYRGNYSRELIVHADAVEPKAMKAVCDILRRPYTRQGIAQIYADIEELAPLKELSLRDDTRELVQMMWAAKRYTDYKRQHDLLDFEDLLLRVYELPEGQLRKYHWIQVDEIQDLNPLQIAIIDRFTASDEAFTVMYLGDNQQAIFSFMGAQMQTLQALFSRCHPETGIHHLSRNYRSPRYLLDIFNEYGKTALGIDPRLLPQSDDNAAHEPEDLQILMSDNNIDEANDVAQLVADLTRQHPSQTTAVIVSYNSEADEMSAALKAVGVEHFKVSGRDVFSEPDVKMLLAHVSVLWNSRNFIAWSRLLTGLKIVASHAAAREFVRKLMNTAMNVSDLLRTDGKTALMHFVEAYAQSDIIVFDTETTGLSILDDDIVQIAAVRLRRGQVVAGPFNVFIESRRDIPPMLGDLPNPLIEEYGRQPHTAPRDAFAAFLDFAKGGVLLAHNATFDYHILDNNLRRHCGTDDLRLLHPFCLDSLEIIRLLSPRLKSHKLKDLLAAFNLEGQNSHMADDDIMATVSLVRHCYEQAQHFLPLQREILDTHRRLAVKFCAAYLQLYNHGRDMLYRPFPEDEPPALVTELAYAYNWLMEHKFIHPVEKLQHLMAYLAQDVVERGERTLAEQLQHHLADINTYKESDLCGSTSMTERVFVSTVHKAKGLEFDNVVIYDVTDGNYPGFFTRQHPGRMEEERRRFYVAISRARRRLFLAWSATKINQYGRVFSTHLSQFTLPIQRFFLMRRA